MIQISFSCGLVSSKFHIQIPFNTYVRNIFRRNGTNKSVTAKLIQKDVLSCVPSNYMTGGRRGILRKKSNMFLNDDDRRAT